MLNLKALGKKYLFYILLISIAINCILVINTIYKADKNQRIEGTYSIKEENEHSIRKYIVLKENGNYIQYNQFSVIAEGRWKSISDNIYTLERVNKPVEYLLNTHSNVMLLSDGSIAEYQKISEKELYIAFCGA